MDARIAAFVEKAREVQFSPLLAEELCLDEFEQIQSAYNTEGSRRKRLYQYRQALEKANLARYFCEHLWLPKQRARALRSAYSQSVADKSENPVPIHNHQAIVSRAIECLHNSSYSVVLCGLVLLCGRRPAELCVTGDFGEYEGRNDGAISFVGQAKTRDREKAETPYIIPLLCDPELFVHAWKRFLTITPKQFSIFAPVEPGKPVDERFSGYSKTFNEAFKRHFADLLPEGASLYDLRHVYTLIVSETRKQPDDHSRPNAFIRKVLGHNKGDLSTAQSYQKYYLAS